MSADGGLAMKESNRPISTKVPKQLLARIDQLVQTGQFASRSEYLRVALLELLLDSNLAQFWEDLLPEIKELLQLQDSD
jgi:Arc/MetJ-type ribon-helix-helix transcriptional regulator